MTPREEDTKLIKALRNGDRVAFETLYHRVAPDLLRYIHQRVRDRAVSEELVQEIFLSLWGRRSALDVHSDIRTYLFGAAKYQILNFMRSEKVRQRYLDHFTLYLAQLDSPMDTSLHLKELTQLVEQHLQPLPPKCRAVFRMSRLEHRSIAEIAEEMHISTRTVENYLTQALKHLRKALSKYAWLLLCCL